MGMQCYKILWFKFSQNSLEVMARIENYLELLGFPFWVIRQREDETWVSSGFVSENQS
jgi:hypothetical protein